MDTPLSPRTALCDALAERLRERILGHEWPAGAALDEGALARDYGVSRTPVREALKLLQHDGLLQGFLGRGVVVASVPPHEAREAQALRGLLLGHAAEQGSAEPSDLLARLLRLVEQRLRLARQPGGDAAAAQPASKR